MVDAVGFVNIDSVCLDGDLSHSGNGITGIDAEVDQNLVDLGGVHVDRQRLVFRNPGEIDPLADQSVHHLKHPRQGFIQINFFGCNDLFAGKSQQLSRQFGGALGRLENFMQIQTHRMVWLYLLQSHLRLPEDHRQHVVEVMGHTTGELAD